ncbi:uncharacterized protein LOC9642751 isoform X2 [Selaginella moellendorffii]|uniref:uncharacterized protein LOC9642751 isoform X2 n=1 Tax=Selaginella moellendorffii TaxID=88036 RepID=UPI000D1C6226|nr:uncharacterized protein LOC9642751 isoform X2 [Selaginella moellendorffii]|eukprot:XP_024531747.1 uncharacterized protein LOC9642751 isoform X2 [Selaginella moellendorffii]
MEDKNVGVNSCGASNAASMIGEKNEGAQQDSPSALRDVAEGGLSGQQQALKTSSKAYDPYTGVLVDSQAGMVTSLDESLEGVDPKQKEQHKAAQRLEKLEDPSCDDSRMSARIKVHGFATSPFAARNDGSEPATDIRSLPVSAATMSMLQRVVTAGLTETADLSLKDMAACAFGVVDSHTEAIVSTLPPCTPGRANNSGMVPGADITELPTTSTLLKKTHIIPDLLDSVEEDGFFLEIAFGNFQVFNGIIIDREVMHGPPSVRVVERSGGSNSRLRSLFLLLLVELEAGGEDYLQWMVLKSLQTGFGHEEILEYRQMPSISKGRHKHVFLLFDTKEAWMRETDAPDRGRFDVHDFVTRHEFGAAVAAVYFESETVC